MNKGKVFLNGGVLGDPELITLKALKILKKAEVILYDRLINEEILKFAPKNAKKVSVGKALSKQNDIQNKIYEH